MALSSMMALGQMDKVPLDMTLEGLRAYGQTQQADQIGLQEMLRKQQFEQQMDPMRLQAQRTSNNTGLQDLAAKTRENKEADFTSNVRMQAQYKGFLQKASDADLGMATNKWQEMAMSRDPKISAQGRAGLSMTKDFLLAKQNQDNQARISAADNARAVQIEKMGIDAGKYNRAGSGGSGPKTEAEIVAKLGYEKASVYYDAKVQEALAGGNDEVAELYRAQANKMKIAAERMRTLAAQQGAEGKVDITGTTQGRVPTRPGANPQGFENGPKLGTKENPIVLK